MNSIAGPSGLSCERVRVSVVLGVAWVTAFTGRRCRWRWGRQPRSRASVAVAGDPGVTRTPETGRRAYEPLSPMRQAVGGVPGLGSALVGLGGTRVTAPEPPGAVASRDATASGGLR